jgi:hypothetical protein
MSKLNKQQPFNPPSHKPQQKFEVTQITESAYLPSLEAEKYELICPGFTKHLIENVVTERYCDKNQEEKVGFR